MQRIKHAWDEIKKFPLILAFFLFLSCFLMADLLTPDHQISELENRNLKQMPQFTWDSFLQNRWTLDYGEYVRDQFPVRDTWMSTYSALEVAQGKLEAGGIWYAKDGYQIAKNAVLTQTQQKQLPINTDALCQLSARYPGRVDVMIVPSPANILSNKLRANPPQIDENTILDDMYAQYSAAGAHVIDLRPVFLANADTQLFYRTDHHWTTDGGAWLAYEEYCRLRALSPSHPPDSMRREVDGFYGTSFSKTKRPGTSAETLVYYDFPAELEIFNYASDGSLTSEPGPIMDTSKLDTYDKYGAFLRGNNGYSVLQGNGEGSVLIIKDSYANCFSPYLTQNYEKIGIIDLRYWRDIDSVFEEGGYDTILVLYSFDSFSSDIYAYRMQDSMQQTE